MGKVDDIAQKGNISPQSEASKMLEAALLQMDGIISGATSQPSPDPLSPKSDGVSYTNLHEAAQNLANLISKSGSFPPPPSNQIRSILSRWLKLESTESNEDDSRIHQLEQEKEALQMHVSVLSEQIEAQSHKINDLEKQLQDKKQLLINAEDLLQREMLSRSSLETQKLELMSAMSELKLQQAALEQKNIELRTTVQNGNYVKKPPIPLTMTSPLPQTSTPNHQITNNRASPSPSPISNSRNDSNSRYRHYGSLPRETTSFSNNNNNNGIILNEEQHQQPKKGVAFAETEKVIPQSPPLTKHNTFKTKIFGSKQKQLDSSFQRNDWTRSTAGARLCPIPKPKRTIKPYSEFTTNDICDFLEEIGLEMYCDEIRGGGILPDIIKNPLHRKKWQLAVNDLEGEKGTQGELDTNWVLRWLDDTGLPQHKDAFANARIDGRMLHMLTMDDLTSLHVTSMLHVCSLKRGIQLLRQCDWDGECLIRRGVSDESERHSSPSEVVLWSAHRVMEWLRACDLAEYAPNLRGAGVHGALMIYEPKFTAELMATLLNIPPSKTLLRRHLSTHFKELLGRDVIQQKRELEATLGYIPLTPGMKLKVVKKSQFSLLRKKSKTEEVDLGDLVCPLQNTSSHSGDELTSNNNTDGTMKRISDGKELAVYHLANDAVGPNGGGLNDVFQKKSDSILV